MLSFVVAMHHLLAEIRASHQNIKEADIYLESTCVFSLYLITVFGTFHSHPYLSSANLGTTGAPVCGAFQAGAVWSDGENRDGKNQEQREQKREW